MATFAAPLGGLRVMRSAIDHRFNAATVTLLASVSGTQEGLLERVRIRHRRHNWLHAPWYAASKGGGALTVGDRIHVTSAHDPSLLGTDRVRWLRWILLMAHEVGHVRQAERFGFGVPGRIRFVLWASWNYVVSFLRNGLKAHAKAGFEREADIGRLQLRKLLERTGACDEHHAIIGLLMADDVQGTRRWLAQATA